MPKLGQSEFFSGTSLGRAVRENLLHIKLHYSKDGGPERSESTLGPMENAFAWGGNPSRDQDILARSILKQLVHKYL